METDKASDFAERMREIARQKEALRVEIDLQEPDQAEVDTRPIEERFDDLWERGVAMMGIEDEHLGGWIEVFGRSKDGKSLKINLDFRKSTIPSRSMLDDIDRRRIVIQWTDDDKNESIGDPEVIGSPMVRYKPNDPDTARRLTLVEQSVTAAERFIEQSSSAPRPELFA